VIKNPLVNTKLVLLKADAVLRIQENHSEEPGLFTDVTGSVINGLFFAGLISFGNPK